MQQKIIDALMAKYQAQKLEAVANLQNYLSNPAGIGEHPNIVKECHKLVKKIAEAEELAKTVTMIIQTRQPNE